MDGIKQKVKELRYFFKLDIKLVQLALDTLDQFFLGDGDWVVVLSLCGELLGYVLANVLVLLLKVLESFRVVLHVPLCLFLSGQHFLILSVVAMLLM